MVSVLQAAVAQLLDQTSRDQWRQIAKDTGLHSAWIRQLALGEIEHASAMRLEILHEHLTGQRFPSAK